MRYFNVLKCSLRCCWGGCESSSLPKLPQPKSTDRVAAIDYDFLSIYVFGRVRGEEERCLGNIRGLTKVPSISRALIFSATALKGLCRVSGQLSQFFRNGMPLLTLDGPVLPGENRGNGKNRTLRSVRHGGTEGTTHLMKFGNSYVWLVIAQWPQSLRVVRCRPPPQTRTDASKLPRPALGKPRGRKPRGVSLSSAGATSYGDLNGAGTQVGVNCGDRSGLDDAQDAFNVREMAVSAMIGCLQSSDPDAEGKAVPHRP